MRKICAFFVLLLLTASVIFAVPRDLVTLLPPNFSFELDLNNDAVPDGWQTIGWQVGDGRVCGTVFVTGSCSVYLATTPNPIFGYSGKQLSVTYAADVPAGVLFRGGVVVQAEQLQAGKGYIVFTLSNGGVVTDSFTAFFDTGTYTWGSVQGSLVTTGEANAITVEIVYKSTTGHLYLDQVAADYQTN